MLKYATKFGQRMPKFRVLCAKKGNIGHRLEKSTPTPVVVVVTNLRYGTADLLPAAKFFSLLHFRRALPLPLKFKYWNAMHKLFIWLRATNRAWQRRNITIHQITTFQPTIYFTLSLILVQIRIVIIVPGLLIVKDYKMQDCIGEMPRRVEGLLFCSCFPARPCPLQGKLFVLSSPAHLIPHHTGQCGHWFGHYCHGMKRKIYS